MILKTLEKCTWDEIEVGEVYADEGCWVINQKINNYIFMVITHTIGDGIIEYMEFGETYISRDDSNLYKLPKSVQKLWKEE